MNTNGLLVHTSTPNELLYLPWYVGVRVVSMSHERVIPRDWSWQCPYCRYDDVVIIYMSACWISE
jgi:hypothetical protein